MRLAAFLLLIVPAAVYAQPPTSAPSYQVTGRVIMDGGSPVPLTTVVEFVCNGQGRRRVRTFANGDFNLTIGGDSTDMPDLTLPRDAFGGQRIPFDPRASTPAGSDSGRFDLAGCELRAVLPGYQSSVISLEPRRLLDKPDVGQIVLRPLVAPEGARKAFENARKILEKERPDYASAARELEKAIVVYPAFAAAWNLMGRTRLAMNDADGARAAFNKSISHDPKYVEPHIHLARLEAQEGHWDETINVSSQALRLDAANPEANYLRALGHFQLSEFEAAEQCALEVQRSGAIERYPITLYILGAIDARKGNFDAAAVKLRQFLESNPDRETADSVRKILAEWAAADQKTTP
jgi:TolA-binding protein